jgi:geranylgeranyl diphosphate synthase type I
MDIKIMLNKRIETVNAALLGTLELEEGKLKRAVRHIPEAGGKRLRPILAMLTADAISGSGAKALPFGISLEIIHTFTLLHDDVMDRDDVRRGVTTVHKEFDESTAINAGDVLFAIAIENLATIDVGDDILRLLIRDVARTVKMIGEGQQLDKDFEKSTNITERDYMKMIEYKTAMLFKMASQGGAMISGGTEGQIEAMTEYGRLLGIGFQIWDDYLDLKADENLLGKPVGSDIKNGKRTLMVVHALERLEGKDRARFLHVLGNENATQQDVRDAISLMDSSGSTAYAEQIALDYAQRSKELLGVLPDSESKDILLVITDYMVKRNK